MWHLVWERGVAPFLRLLENAELGSLMIFSSALAFFGYKITPNHPATRRVAGVLAALSFVALIGFWSQSQAFVGAISDLAIRGLLGAGAVFGVACILAIPTVALYQATLAAGFRGVRRWIDALGRRRADRREQRARSEDLARRAEVTARQRAIAEEHAKENAAAQKRRQEARASCEVLFAKHSPELSKRFTRDMFDDFVLKHLADAFAPDYVERRAEELKGLIRLHLKKADPPRKNLAELAQWFLAEKEQIEEAALAEEDRQMLLAQLEERFVRLQEQYLRSVQP